MNSKVLSYMTWICLLIILANSVLYLDEVPLIRVFFSLFRLAAVAFAIIIAVKNKNFGGGYMKWLIAFFLTLGIITVLKRGATNMVISNLLNSFGIALLLYNAIKESPKMAIRVFSSVFSFLIYLNFLTILVAPGGIFDGSYLIGRNYNQIGMSLICGMVTNVVAYNMGVKHFTTVLILCIVCLMTTIITGSMTSAVGCLLTTGFLFIKKKELKRIVLIVFFAFYVLFQSFVVFMQSDVSGMRAITYVIENVMGKDLSFSDRARVWMIAYDFIQDSPVLGYGMQKNEWFEETFLVKSAHNIIFQIMIYGGIVLLSCLVIVIIVSVHHAKKEKTALTYTIMLGLCTAFFMMMMENYSMVLILYMTCLLYNSNLLSKAVHTIALEKKQKKLKNDNSHLLDHHSSLQYAATA